MKIIVFIYSMHRPGGTERAATDLAEGFQRNGHEVTIMTTDKNSKTLFYEIDKEIRILNLSIMGNYSKIKKVLNFFPALYYIRNTIISESPDVVISFCDKLNVLLSASLLFKNIPIILTEHFTPGFYNIGLFWDILRELFYRKAKYITVLTEKSKEYFSITLKKKIVVMPNIVRASTDKKDSNVSKRIIAVGRLRESKGFDILINAFKIISDKYEDWILEIWGDGELKSDLTNQIKDLELERKVFLRGVTRNIQYEMLKSDIFVLSSRVEGFGLVLCEAMSIGLAVVSTDCPYGPKEIVTNYYDGLLVENENEIKLAEAMELLIADKTLRKKLGLNAIESMSKFSEKNIIDRWEKLFC
ncbi:MAG: glycosyltransferase family 4 protein [Candidatus Delongbacteria bacterium]|nr:glycosyltransferase family 4 protein [Candidatus Delongbacteria bacterium]MBN2836849.1 glycosyltransferase family 4 protein [Candidatus Delongbacteria bacterium]